jgi:microsomal dipeptidase-like Zn-dependent dipeptidase
MTLIAAFALVGFLVIAASLLTDREKGTALESVVRLPTSVSVSDEGSESCGGGSDYQCGRAVTLQLLTASSLRDLIAQLRRSGFPVALSEDDTWDGCDRSGRRCVSLVPESESVASLEVTEWRSG